MNGKAAATKAKDGGTRRGGAGRIKNHKKQAWGEEVNNLGFRALEMVHRQVTRDAHVINVMPKT